VCSLKCRSTVERHLQCSLVDNTVKDCIGLVCALAASQVICFCASWWLALLAILALSQAFNQCSLAYLACGCLKKWTSVCNVCVSKHEGTWRMSHDGKNLNTITGTFVVFDRVSHYLCDLYLCPQQPFHACQCTTQNVDVILTLLHSFIKHDGSCTHTHIQR